MTWWICWKEFPTPKICVSNPIHWRNSLKCWWMGFWNSSKWIQGMGFFFQQKDDGQKCRLKAGAIPWYQWIYKIKRYRICVQNVFPTLLRPDLFSPRFFGFHMWSHASLKPWGTSLFFGAFVVPWLGKNIEKKSKKLEWFLGCFSSPCWFISSLCWGVAFPTRQDATVKYFDLLEFLVWFKMINLHFFYH